MECPKCHSIIKDNTAVCPKCHKVLLLECPNCHTAGESAICSKCGYTILVKCSKCSKIVNIKNEKCSKCGFPTAVSLAYQECETDDFASVIIKFGSLRSIRRLLKSQELYTKFFFKLKNLLYAQIKGVEGKFITYNDVFVLNFNKELSFTTSSNKAVRFALKAVNAFAELNSNIMEELGVPLNLSFTIVKKQAEKLQELSTYENNVKPLNINKKEKKYLKGLQIVLDQYVRDEINKEYKTDSLYTVETDGKTIMFYEILLDSYVLPPAKETYSKPVEAVRHEIKNEDNKKEEQDIYSFKVFDINAKCKFERTNAAELFEKLDIKHSKIIAIRASRENYADVSSLVKFLEKEDFNVLRVSCTEAMNYRPWGFFEALFRDYCKLAFFNGLNDLSKINPQILKIFKPLFDFLSSTPVKAMTPEDARFAYMEQWGKFLGLLNKTAVVVDGFEYLDDTSIQTLQLYFDKFKNIKPLFVFLTDEDCSVQSKMKELLRTPLYKEYTLNKASMDACLAELKADASDFIQSFYFEKIKENARGSYLYFSNAIQYLKDSGVLINFENKLLIKNKKSVILPKSLKELMKSRIKMLSENMNISLIFAYSVLLDSRLDFMTLEHLGIKDVEKNAKLIADAGLADVKDGFIYINNFNLVCAVIKNSLKKAALEFLGKNIIAKLGKGLKDSTLALIMGKLGAFKEEYLTLWRNSLFAIKTGDYDAYLKNCLGFLSLVEQIESNISKEDIEENKKDVYNNILLCLYSYSPAKIYFIENILLVDAINQGDDDKIVKLSNLMLQGALISSNYTDAAGLLHNILSRMQNAALVVDGAVNTKFLLLSLVNIEILYNIGDFRACADIAQEILSVLSPDILDKVKPASFSTNLFVSHLMETCRLAGFAKLFLLDDDIEAYFEQINKALNTELPDKECILAIRDFLAGKVYLNGNIEEYPAFSKVIFLILQEFAELKDDYKRFSQNIYQAKLLAEELRQREIVLFCDLLIAYSYAKIGINKKAEAIYADVLETAEKSAMFNILAIAKYFSSLSAEPEKALLLINDTLAMIQKYDNQSKILYALFENLYIKIAEESGLTAVDIESEKQKLEPLKEDLKRLLPSFFA